MTVTMESFGLDCLGNCTGWRVAEYGPRGHFRVLSRHVGDIYDPPQRKAAHEAAMADFIGFASRTLEG